MGYPAYAAAPPAEWGDARHCVLKCGWWHRDLCNKGADHSHVQSEGHIKRVKWAADQDASGADRRASWAKKRSEQQSALRSQPEVPMISLSAEASTGCPEGFCTLSKGFQERCK